MNVIKNELHTKMAKLKIKSFVWSVLELYIIFHCGFQIKVTCAFLLQENINRNYQILILVNKEKRQYRPHYWVVEGFNWVPVWIGHWNLCMEGHLKLRFQMSCLEVSASRERVRMFSWNPILQCEPENSSELKFTEFFFLQN